MVPVATAVLSAVAPELVRGILSRLLPQREAARTGADPRPELPPVDVEKIARELTRDAGLQRVAEEAVRSVAKPWWQSKGVLGGAGVVLMSVGSIVGLAITAEDAGAITDNLDKIATGLFGLYAIYGRLVARSPLK